MHQFYHFLLCAFFCVLYYALVCALHKWELTGCVDSTSNDVYVGSVIYSKCVLWYVPLEVDVYYMIVLVMHLAP